MTAAPSNFTLDRTAGSPALAAARQRERWAEEESTISDVMLALAVATQAIPLGTVERVLEDQAEGGS